MRNFAQKDINEFYTFEKHPRSGCCNALISFSNFENDERHCSVCLKPVTKRSELVDNIIDNFVESVTIEEDK